jgi:hypothetical protein
MAFASAACSMDWPDDEIGKNRSGSADRQAAKERQSLLANQLCHGSAAGA